ncbi:hypothetical protein SLS62_003012 [Diatrype stigma]|uniref:Uncharacterized protein n=1 Tax=Diatrype stigma TaxID=117547 RepID=A0AAN9V7G2_9PEZI
MVQTHVRKPSPGCLFEGLRNYCEANFAVAVLIYYGCYQIYSSAVLGTLGRWLDEEEAQVSEADRKELEEEEGELFFIPLPFTTKQVEPLPYKGSDPEWQTFIKMSKNPRHLREIERSKAHLLHRICLDDDGISIEDRPVSSLDVFRVRRTLWPSPLAMSLWSFTGALMKQNAAAVSKAVGFETQDQPNATVQQTFEQVQKQLQQSQVKPDSKSPDSLPRTQSQGPDGSSSAPTSSSTPRATPGTPSVNQALPPSPNASDRRQKSAREIYAVKMAQEHTSGPWQAFKQKLSQTWRPLHDYPPRGSVSVSGIVELDMPRARVTVEAFAWWDPKTEKFDGRSFYIRWRSIRPKVQNPLR